MHEKERVVQERKSQEAIEQELVQIRKRGRRSQEADPEARVGAFPAKLVSRVSEESFGGKQFIGVPQIEPSILNRSSFYPEAIFVH